MVPAEVGWAGVSLEPGTIAVSVATVVSDLGGRASGSAGIPRQRHKNSD